MTTETLERREVLGPVKEFEPDVFGPVWQTNEDGDFLLPDYTLGVEVIAWCADWLVGADGEGPWIFTFEQARFILWYYAIDQHGKWLYRDAVLQRIKGWGKDPLAAVICAVELVGPCRFHYWRGADGERLDAWAPGAEPVARDRPSAWIQIAATAREQTKNTMLMLAGRFTKAALEKYGIEVHKEIIHAAGGRRIEVVTTANRTMEGNRPSLVIKNETHHWVPSVGGDEFDKVIRRNVNKMRRQLQSRTLAITNAYSDSEDSVAKKQRESFIKEMEAKGTSRVLYDTLEASKTTGLYPRYTEIDADGNAVKVYDEYGVYIPPSPEVVAEHLRRILNTLRGDAVWLDSDETIEEILEPQSSPAEMRRFYLNSVMSEDDSYLLDEDLAATILETLRDARRHESGDALRLGWGPVMPDDPVALFFDGSKSDDSTAIVGCRVSDGYVFLAGIWAKPKGDAGRNWLAPRNDVDGRVTELFDRFNVVAFWGDPSHAKDDEGGTRYWDTLLDKWHIAYGERLQYWAVQGGDHRSSTMWDMTSPTNQKTFSEAVVRFRDEMEDHDFAWDGHPVLREHMRNAKAYMGVYGMVIRKPSRGGTRKIDAAVCAVGAKMLARLVSIKGLEEEEVVDGTFWW